MMSLVFVVPKHVALDSFATLRPALVLPLTAPLPSVSTRIRNYVNVEIHNAVLINIVYLFKTDVKHKTGSRRPISKMPVQSLDDGFRKVCMWNTRRMRTGTVLQS